MQNRIVRDSRFTAASVKVSFQFQLKIIAVDEALKKIVDLRTKTSDSKKLSLKFIEEIHLIYFVNMNSYFPRCRVDDIYTMTQKNKNLQSTTNKCSSGENIGHDFPLSEMCA